MRCPSPHSGAVLRAIGFEPESRLADRPVQRDERWHRIACAKRRCDTHLWIDSRRRTADCRLHVAASTTIEIETWTETIADSFLLAEIDLAGIEVALFLARQIRHREPGSRCSSTHAGCGRAHWVQSKSCAVACEELRAVSQRAEFRQDADYAARVACGGSLAGMSLQPDAFSVAYPNCLICADASCRRARTHARIELQSLAQIP
jgi:hypothetical protein